MVEEPSPKRKVGWGKGGLKLGAREEGRGGRRGGREGPNSGVLGFNSGISFGDQDSLGLKV